MCEWMSFPVRPNCFGILFRRKLWKVRDAQLKYFWTDSFHGLSIEYKYQYGSLSAPDVLHLWLKRRIRDQTTFWTIRKLTLTHGKWIFKYMSKHLYCFLTSFLETKIHAHLPIPAVIKVSKNLCYDQKSPLVFLVSFPWRKTVLVPM